MSNFLSRAIDLAVGAHWDQEDKNGAPYILHPLRVMLSMETELEMAVAVLHDVIEDTHCELLDVAAIAPDSEIEEFVGAMDAITRRDDEKYSDYIDRVSKNTLATKVKLSDLKDNLRPGCPKPDAYRRAIELLSKSYAAEVSL